MTVHFDVIHKEKVADLRELLQAVLEERALREIRKQVDKLLEYLE